MVRFHQPVSADNRTRSNHGRPPAFADFTPPAFFGRFGFPIAPQGSAISTRRSDQHRDIREISLRWFAGERQLDMVRCWQFRFVGKTCHLVRFRTEDRPKSHDDHRGTHHAGRFEQRGKSDHADQNWVQPARLGQGEQSLPADQDSPKISRAKQSRERERVRSASPQHRTRASRQTRTPNPRAATV